MADERKWQTMSTVNDAPAYNKTTWNNSATPPIDADHLNNIETGILNATQVTNDTVGAVNTLKGNVETLDTDIKTLDTKLTAADTALDNKIKQLTFETIYNQTKTTIVFDGGEETDN